MTGTQSWIIWQKFTNFLGSFHVQGTALADRDLVVTKMSLLCDPGLAPWAKLSELFAPGIEEATNKQLEVNTLWKL